MGSGTVVMLPSWEDGPNAHPFWYAEVLGTFFFTINYTGTKSIMEVLWIHWFGIVPGHHWEFKYAQLPKIRFILSETDTTFRFIDPALVIWSLYLEVVTLTHCYVMAHLLPDRRILMMIRWHIMLTCDILCSKLLIHLTFFLALLTVTCLHVMQVLEWDMMSNTA